MTLTHDECLQAIDAFLDIHGNPITPSNTRRAYDTVMRQWVEWCGQHGVHLVQPEAGECAAFRDHVAEDRSAATIRLRCGTVRGMIELAIDTGRVPGPNPWKRVKLPVSPKQSTTRGLTRVEQRRLHEWCSTQGSTRTYALVRLMGVLGLRVSEALAFDMTRLTMDTDGWRYRFTGKGGKERVIGVDDRTVDAIQAHRKPGDPNHLFPGRVQGSTLHRATAVSDIDAACRGAGVPRISPHGFRHSAITRVLEATGDIAVAQQVAGHESVVTTMRYDRRTGLQERGVAAIVGALDEGTT